jgi:L-seryl-tRNA(Ser) seleniumtransferase
MIEADAETLLKKAQYLCRILQDAAASAEFAFSVIETLDAVGGGAFPAENLPGFGVGIRASSFGAERLAGALRTASIPVIPGVREDQVILHVRTLLDGDVERITASFLEAAASAG